MQHKLFKNFKNLARKDYRQLTYKLVESLSTTIEFVIVKGYDNKVGSEVFTFSIPILFITISLCVTIKEENIYGQNL
jgi:hypothetical protein